ncbi:unnamed protein product [Rotaria sp. Silwood2]|nr:unnamed protein product [Rotaria sp. Silwood2]
MKIFICLTILLQIFVLQVRTNECELTLNDEIQLTANDFIQSQQLCNTSNFSMTNRRRISITGRLLDYTTRCQKSISNANVEIIRIHSNPQLICSDLHHPNSHGYFNLTNVILRFNEKVLLRVTSPGYKTIYKKIRLPLSYERSEEKVVNYQIVLTIDTKQNQSQHDERMKSIVDRLLCQMTLDEKIGQLNLLSINFNADGAGITDNLREKIHRGGVGGILNTYTPKAVRQLQELAINSTRLKIPLIFGFDVIHGHKTIFPVPLGLSSTWNMTLIEQSARIAAREATADAINWVYSPMVDIARDPRWGRIVEGAGEDPWLGSQIAAAMVRGFQGHNLSLVDTVMSCFKHFALYGAAEGGRDYNTVDMSPLRMYEYYLPPYLAAVKAGAGSVMTSFNEINGIPSTGNQWLLNDLLRNQWNFTGFVVSDWNAVSEMTVHGLGNLQEVSVRAITAGVDMDMISEGFLTTLNKSIQEGKLTEQTINQACRRVLEAKYKLGLFDDPFRYINESRAQTDLFTQENRLAAKDFARRSFVLLKNDKQILPLSRSNLTIALVGPLADDQRNLLGAWKAAGEYNQTVSVIEGINQLLGKNIQILHAKGANFVEDLNMLKILNAYGRDVILDNRTATEMIDEALQAANKSDVIVAVVGETRGMSGEARSRGDIGLPDCQKVLLQALFNIGKPVVIVLMNGRPLTLTWEDQYATAILETWFAGTETGNAIAEVLFGYYNPAGKLTATFPRSVGQIPLYYNHKNTGRPYNSSDILYTDTSRFIDIPNDPLYPFGYGLSYTTFTFGPLNVDKTKLHGDADRLTIRVVLSNTGAYDGEEVVQLYIADPVASVTRAVRELKNFQKVFLRTQERKEISFLITTDDLKFFDSHLNYIWEEGAFNIYIGPDSVNTQSLFIEKNELNRLQDIVDIATLQHGSRNVLHDLAFTLIEGEKIKQAEKIFRTPWLKARNSRINLHALLFADSNNLDALIEAIKLTRNLPGVNQSQLFTSAIRVALRLNQSDMIDWLIKEIQENRIQLDIRIKKYLDAHLLSKGLDPLNIEAYKSQNKNEKDSISSASDDYDGMNILLSL